MVKVNVGQRCPSGLFATPAPTTAQHQVGGKIKSWHWNSFIVCGKLNLSLINWVYRWIWNTFPKMYEGNTVLPAGQEYNSWIFIFLQNLLGVFNQGGSEPPCVSPSPSPWGWPASWGCRAPPTWRTRPPPRGPPGTNLSARIDKASINL